ncbi:glycerol-3-phosphate dehydrogenase/oxidase [Marinobacter sp.]|uniref:glycerol-3-phosphate dehydrogenase/oxidase n=1 Tax=Marinobacter sp. TaxID=50741 RepID=UPI00384EA40A
MSPDERKRLITSLARGNRDFDLVVIGGGITGAGIVREAAGSGLRTLLVEQMDFAWGTSSRSSKMVHGGLRYLASGHFGLARDAVRERQRMLEEAPGLVDPLQFVMPHYKGQFPGPGLFGILLRVYDWLAGQQSRRFFSPGEALQWVPGLSMDRLRGASGFTDAVTDDARLVMRVLQEARADGATCVNYVRATEILRNSDGNVTGVRLEDAANGDSGETSVWNLNTPIVINATGAWADSLRASGRDNEHIRPLRGSHLVLPYSALPVSCSVSALHPDDRRPVFAFPWQGVTVLGTTDLDHNRGLEQEPVITEPEIDYLLEVAARLFPASKIRRDQILSSWAGVRPVVSRGDGKSPSKENREHVIWADRGLLSIAGGKLTTFRKIAREVIEKAQDYLPEHQLRPDQEPVFRQPTELKRPSGIPHLQWRRLQGFHGSLVAEMLTCGPAHPIPGTSLLWAEVIWAASQEDVMHLDDLMLRRTRLGLILPGGGRDLLPEIRTLCQPKLGWDDSHWDKEEQRYLEIWSSAYFLPESPDTPGANA